MRRMVNLRDKISAIIQEEKRKKHFSVLDDSSIELIQQIFNNYEATNDLKQDFNNIPKSADLVFVAAPTGAGKDNLVIKLNIEEPDKNYIELNMDIFRHYFSKFIPDISTLKDKTFAEQTNEFSYEMYVTIQEILLSEFPGTNIIITGTLWKTDWVEETFRRYKADTNTDYRIRLVSLAVPKKESAISIIKRYISIVDTQLQSDDFQPGTARYTSLKYHNDTFERFPTNLKYFEDLFRSNPGELIDSMQVYKRNSQMLDYTEDTLVYSSEREEDSEQTAVRAVLRLRSNLPRISNEDVLELLNLISKNKKYIDEQGVLMEIMTDLGSILGYEKILKSKVSEFKSGDDEPKI